MGRWKKRQNKAWRKQLFEVQSRRQARGLAGAAMCETRDFGHQPAAAAHPLIFGEKVTGGHESGLPSGREKVDHMLFGR